MEGPPTAAVGPPTAVQNVLPSPPPSTNSYYQSAKAIGKSALEKALQYTNVVMYFLILCFLIFIMWFLIGIRRIVGKIWKKKERYIPSHELFKTPILGENEEGYATDSDDEDTLKPKKKKKSDEEGYKGEMEDEDTPKPKKKKASDEEGYKGEMEDEETPKPKKKTPAPEDFIPVYTNNTIVSEGYYTGARENFVQQQPRRLFNIFA